MVEILNCVLVGSDSAAVHKHRLQLVVNSMRLAPFLLLFICCASTVPVERGPDIEYYEIQVCRDTICWKQRNSRETIETLMRNQILYEIGYRYDTTGMRRVK